VPSSLLCTLSTADGYALRVQVHPRINFISAVMRDGSDDIAHFILSFMMIFAMFAMLAHATFGESLSEYSTFSKSFTTQFKVITTGIDTYGDESFAFVFYVLLLCASHMLMSRACWASM
jgi:hypothetical protein